MDNSGAANTERALVLYNNNQKRVNITSLYIDFTEYGPFPTKLNNKAKALNQSESFPKSYGVNEIEAAEALLDMKNKSSKKPETAAATGSRKKPTGPRKKPTGPQNEPRYVSLHDLIRKEKI